MPKPTKVTLSSLANESVIAEIIASTTSPDTFFVNLVWSATSSTNSALSIFPSPCKLGFRRALYFSEKRGIGQKQPYFDEEKSIYKKIVLKNNRIVGAIFVGDIERAGIYTGLIKDKVDATSFREHILKEDFGLISLPKEYRKHLVTGLGIEV